jgi:hypothetical protein
MFLRPFYYNNDKLSFGRENRLRRGKIPAILPPPYFFLGLHYIDLSDSLHLIDLLVKGFAKHFPRPRETPYFV